MGGVLQLFTIKASQILAPRRGLVFCGIAAACIALASFHLPAQSEAQASPGIRCGRNIWFNATFGDEKYYALLAQLPDPTQRILIGFTNVLTTPRASRFDQWGMINDPDCKANPAGGLDICDDPQATGVVGIRQTKAPN